jgi:hypothetical protein
MTSRLIIVAAVCASACTGAAFLHGARIASADQSLSGVVATWDVGMCVDPSGAQAGLPPIRYHMLQGTAGPELFERSNDGSGSIVENSWTDERGTHFYQWVRRQGWEIVVTAPGQPGVRNVYLDTSSPGGRPEGAIGATCPLTPAANP